MRLLALDTATEACTVALLTEHGLISESIEIGRGHAQEILGMVDRVLAQGGVTLASLSGIAAGVGPGSFTGVRVSVAVAQGLAFGAGLPVVPVSSLEALALQAIGRGAERTLACLDARMGEVYFECFAAQPAGLLSAFGPPAVGPPAGVRLPDAARAGSGPLHGIGRGFAVYPELLRIAELSVDPADASVLIAPVAQPLVIDAAYKPFVILVAGVNGSGKTTTIGKLAARLRAEGRSVMMAAGDTFRAAAIDQLKIWSDRTGSAFVAKEAGADAAGLVFDALRAAKERNVDVLLVDTAGRLQNRSELMDELQKIVRVIKKADPSAPHAVLLVLDATVGQNALSQVEIFRKVVGVTGLAMTKLDGTARGGILVAIADKFALPVHFIGVGESVDDLEPFAARDFAEAIAGVEQAEA